MIEGLGEQLKLDDRQRGPSANTLRYYGNTSSSTVWYSLGFVESCQGLARGDTVWQARSPPPSTPHTHTHRQSGRRRSLTHC